MKGVNGWRFLPPSPSRWRVRATLRNVGANFPRINQRVGRNFLRVEAEDERTVRVQ